MSAARLGIGVIGAGVIGRTHLSSLTQDPACEIIGLADPMPAAAELAVDRGLTHYTDHGGRRARPDQLDP